MSSQDVIKTTAKKLKYYMEVKRLEDAFDLSGPDKPQRHYPTLKPRPTLLYDGLHDRALKHYFRNAEVKKHLAQMKPRSSQNERESKVRRDVDLYMEKSHPTSPYTSLVRARPPPKKRRSNFRGGPLLLRSRHGPQLSRGETERLVNAATQLLVATETIPIDQKNKGRRHSGKNYRADSGVGGSLPTIGSGRGDYGYSPSRPDRPKSTYGHRPTRPRSSYGERPRPKSAAEMRPKSAAKASPSTARYGYDSLGRKIKLHLEQPRHYEASESDQDPDDYDDDDFEDSLDSGMNILVPVQGSSKSQSPEWLNIQMSKVDMNDHYDDEEEEEEEEEPDTISQGDEVLHSIDNTTQTGREISCQTVEKQDNTKDTQTRRANTEESMTDPYQADMAIQTAPPPVTSGTQTLVPPPEVSTQTIPPQPTIGTQTFPEVYCQTTPIFNMETQTEVHQPEVACQVEPPLEIGVQVDPPPPPPSPPPPPEPEPEPEEDYEFLKHGPRLKSGKRTIYELSIHTGNRLGASTRADVHVTLYGEKGNTGKIKLKQTKESKDGKKVKFQKGQIDVFKVESYYVGKVECICIGHDKRELGCGWFLDKVMIREYGDDVTYEFLCERWLSAQDEDGRTVRTIPVTNIIMDVSSSSHSEPDQSDYVEKSPDSSAYTDTDLHLHQVTSMDGHFVRSRSPAVQHSDSASASASASQRICSSEHSDSSRRRHRRHRRKKGKSQKKSHKKSRTPVTTTGTESETDSDTDSEDDRSSQSRSDDDDDSGSGSGSSGTGSSSGSNSDSSGGSGSSSDNRKADGESKNGSIRSSGRYRDRSGKDSKEDNTERLPQENAGSKDDPSPAQTRTGSDNSSSDSPSDHASKTSLSHSENSGKTDTKDVPKSKPKDTTEGDSASGRDTDASEYMTGFKAALKMKEQQKEREAEAKEEEEERQRQEEEALLMGPTIHQSCKKGDLDRVKKLLQHNPELINSPDERGWTPLHVASASGRLDIVKFLAANNTSIGDLTPTGYTAMHMAAMNGHVAVVKMLAAMGMTVDCRTVDEQTPLHMAAMSGHLECTKWLVANDSPLDVIDNMGRTAQDLAEEYQHQEVTTFLKSCQRELTRQDSSLSMLRSRSPSMGSQNRRSLPTSDSEKDTSKDAQSSDEESKPDSVAAKQKEEQKHAVLERKKSFKDQQERMSSKGMSFLDSIRAEYSDNEEPQQ